VRNTVRWCKVSAVHNTFRLAAVSNDGVCWMLRRNCSVTPGQLFWMFLSLCGVSFGVAGFFWFQGASLVLPFTAVELVAVGTAFLVYARHATDHERICLNEGRLVVEQETAGKTQRSEFGSQAVWVEPPGGGDQLVEVHGGGLSVRVGRHLRPDLRVALTRELRMALKGC